MNAYAFFFFLPRPLFPLSPLLGICGAPIVLANPYDEGTCLFPLLFSAMLSAGSLSARFPHRGGFGLGCSFAPDPSPTLRPLIFEKTIGALFPSAEVERASSSLMSFPRVSPLGRADGDFPYHGL